VMAALVCRASLTAEEFAAFVVAQGDLGPKQRPKYVRIVEELPRTATHKVLKRELAAEGVGGDGTSGTVWQLDYS
jgi:fatty-acyl-CoA synthase